MGDLYQRILREGRLCISEDNRLYIGSVPVLTDPKGFRSCSVVEYGSDNESILKKTVSFTLPDKKESIYDNILKPFSDSKISDTIRKPADWFCCINELVSFDKLFMYILKHKYDKDYSKFMKVFMSNLDSISWNAYDDDGNTMLHYVTIMNKYSACACDIIRHVKENHTNLINRGNSRGVVPLVSVLHDGFICRNTKEANSDIIRGLIDAGANFL